MTDATAGAASRRLSTADRVYGAVGAIAIVLAAWFLVRGGPDTGAAAVSRPPRLVIEDPRPGAVLDQPAAILFDTRAKLAADGTDSAAARHVHVNAGETMLMPGPGDIQRMDDGRYLWRLPRLPAGATTLVIYWSDAQHRAVAAASADTVEVTLR